MSTDVQWFMAGLIYGVTIVFALFMFIPEFRNFRSGPPKDELVTPAARSFGAACPECDGAGGFGEADGYEPCHVCNTTGRVHR